MREIHPCPPPPPKKKILLALAKASLFGLISHFTRTTVFSFFFSKFKHRKDSDFLRFSSITLIALNNITHSYCAMCVRISTIYCSSSVILTQALSIVHQLAMQHGVVHDHHTTKMRGKCSLQHRRTGVNTFRGAGIIFARI